MGRDDRPVFCSVHHERGYGCIGVPEGDGGADHGHNDGCRVGSFPRGRLHNVARIRGDAQLQFPDLGGDRAPCQCPQYHRLRPHRHRLLKKGVTLAHETRLYG